MSYIDKYNEWLNNEIIDNITKDEMKALSDKEIEESFYKDLEFGTAGLRGIMGPGTNRMNKYTIAKITEGIANFIINKGYNNPSVVIAYDSRHNSKLFATIAALVLNKKNIKTYIFKELTATPVLAYASLYLKTSMAINITSSHNSKEYNGYKIYNNEGYQVVNPDDIDITNEINKITTYQNIELDEVESMIQLGLFNYVDDEVINNFIGQTKKQIKERYDDNRNLNIIYTPLHGTGDKIMTNLLNSIGFKNVYSVLEQKEPNGDFPTTPYPNPEDITTFDMAVRDAKIKDADIIVSTDPDADRLGIMIKDDYGEYTLLSGNQVGVLIGSYVLENTDDLDNGVIVRSIVSTKMIDKMAEESGVNIEEVYTGTKYIGEKIYEYQNSLEKKYIYGFEESIGYLVGTYTRDKNGFSSALVMCELAELLHEQGKTIMSHLKELYNKYGYYLDKTISEEYKGVDGMKNMNSIMNNLRNNYIEEINGCLIIKKDDFLSGTSKDIGENEGSNILLPPSNVLRYTLEDGSWFAIRPSGTEPKIKIYMQAIDQDETIAKSKLIKMENDILKLMK
jgi:Phosphomannomutase